MGLFLLIAILAVLVTLYRCSWSWPKLNERFSQPIGFLYVLRTAILVPILVINQLIRKWRRRANKIREIEQNALKRVGPLHSHERIEFFGSDKLGNVIMICLRRHFDRVTQVEITLRLSDGRVFTHPFNCGELATDEPTNGDEDGDSAFAAGIRIHTIEPVQTYRILYSGKLKSPDGDYRATRLRLWFRALSDPVDEFVDYCPIKVAESLGREPSWLELASDFIFGDNLDLQQSGELSGVINMDQGETTNVTMNGVRNLALVDNLRESAHGTCQGLFDFKARFENGLVASMKLESRQQATHFESGFVTYQTGYVYPLTWTDHHLSQWSFSNGLSSNFSFVLAAHNQYSLIDVEVLHKQDINVINSSASSKALALQCYIVKVSFNKTVNGYGTVVFNNNGKTSSYEQKIPIQEKLVTMRQIQKPVASPSVPYCLQFSDEKCRLPHLTGGKASKLADIEASLRFLTSEASKLIKVPPGFAITISAYQNHLKSNPNLATKVQYVLSIKDSEVLQKACDELLNLFKETPIGPDILSEIETHLKMTFGDFNFESTYTAVRSSAVGEDGIEASGAGQMETFLGRKGLNEISESVKLCWASHFSYRAIQYRRQLCGNLDLPMAVVVQRLVDADAAGVMFTRHPDTNATLLNVCFGIGEGVVSGVVHPDTISISQLDPFDSKSLEITYEVIGDKASAFKLDTDAGGVVEKKESDQAGSKACLEDEEVRRLFEVGRVIEQIFGGSRDVEFALSKKISSVYVLQARPITTTDLEDEWELTHELDTPLASDQEYITTANVQEMMPGALTPLAGKLWVEGMEYALQGVQVPLIKPRRRFPVTRYCPMSQQHVFMNWTMIGSSMVDEYKKTAGEMAVFCRKLDVPTAKMMQEQNDIGSKFWQIYLNVIDWKRRLFPRNDMTSLVETIENFYVPAATNPAELYKQIKKAVDMFSETWRAHIGVSSMASVYSMVIMHTIDQTMDWGATHYDDMSVLLSSCTDVFSADVPTQMQGIADSIRRDDEGKSFFLAADRSDAASWLLSDSSKEAGNLFRKFLQKHGHRCVRDSDIRERSWSQEPEKLVDALRVMVASNGSRHEVNSKKPELGIEEAIDKIKNPINFIQRMVIKMMLPKARKAVGNREWAKSYGIKMTDNVRRLYFRLSEILMEQGSIPDADLMFFLTPREIEAILVRKSPKLIAKAMRRRKLFKAFDDLSYPEVTNGHPQGSRPTVDDSLGRKEGNFNIEGMAIGNGCIRGKARVVKSLQDANKIEPGDVLIVPYTDVGWTPYFPMVSGLVTELGGLISHGAVVAREYGLPCLVGCKKATDLVKTGDQVFINSPKGRIEVQPKDEAI